MVVPRPPWISPGCIPQRFVVCFLCFLGLALAYIMRFCLSIAITEMVVGRKPEAANGTNATPDSCPYPQYDNETLRRAFHEGEFEWSEKTQGLILSSFFWGYVVTQLPGGLAAERWGGKVTLGIGVVTSSVGSLLTPFAARAAGPSALITLRVLIGLGQGLIYPALHVITAQWVPTQERGRLGCLVFAGANFGNIISMGLSGVLLGQMEGGWPIVFYLYGSLGLLWALAWYFLVYSSPNHHPNLTEREKKILQEYSISVQMSKRNLPTPWKDILTCWPLWALVIGQVGHDWGLFTIITDLPKYMKSVMHYTITENGLLLSLPYLLMWIVAITSGYFVDWLLAMEFFGVTCARKIFTTVASVGPALGILGAMYSECNRGSATAFFIIGMGFMGFFYPSLKVNALDLSPNFAGTISALVIGIGAISGILTPYLVGLLTPDSTLAQWKMVFWIAITVLIATNMVYILLGSGEVQPWNSKEEDETEKKAAGPQSIKSDDGFQSIQLTDTLEKQPPP